MSNPRICFPIRHAVRAELGLVTRALVIETMLNDSKQIFASKYKLLLSTEEELQQNLNQELLYLKQQGVPYNG